MVKSECVDSEFSDQHGQETDVLVAHNKGSSSMSVLIGALELVEEVPDGVSTTPSVAANQGCQHSRVTAVAKGRRQEVLGDPAEVHPKYTISCLTSYIESPQFRPLSIRQ